MNLSEAILVYISLAIAVLLLLGILKWIIGFCIPGVSQWGLNVLVNGSCAEMDISSRDSGRSIDIFRKSDRPQTIRICSRKLEFFLNLTFFLTFPIAVCCNLCNGSMVKMQDCSDESHTRLIDGNTSTKTTPKNNYGELNHISSTHELEEAQNIKNQLIESREASNAERKLSKAR
ncbi:GSCOCG00001711001-RA-CDS [Cotesia congregata]|uniref:Uncharacterized protein n=1 Tax=Cotesia congregata TaxID=51543 RepID=A0A8J2HMQ5_COTCN|nr:GSCOCG00001711001-RA-CDS [Cotesia congregata]CAG5107079.1 Protein of unknown function [Cotesia congregata]